MTAKPWWESKTMWAGIFVFIGVVCIGLGEWQDLSTLKWVGMALAGVTGPAVPILRPGATQPLTLTRARARKSEETS